MATLLRELGAAEANLTEEKINQLFKIANLDGGIHCFVKTHQKKPNTKTQKHKNNKQQTTKDDDIDFKEFLIAAAMGCFLTVSDDEIFNEKEKHSDLFIKQRRGFRAIEITFKKIDVDNSG